MNINRIWDMVKVRREQIKVQVEVKKKLTKGGKSVDVPAYEEWWNTGPIGYHMNPLRELMREKASEVAHGSRSTMKKGVGFQLTRYPQVHTVMGELKHAFKGVKLIGDWTSEDEANSLYVIKAA